MLKPCLFLITLTTVLFLINSKLAKIDVYLESLCPDCGEFIRNSFAEYLSNPDYKSLAEVEFYPYGNAHETLFNDRYIFRCQHGSKECYGNTVQVCALNKMDYETGLKFMVCIENDLENNHKNIDKALSSCVSDEKLMKAILECAEGTEGNLLQHNVALATHPDHTYVPWVVFNGIHDQEIEDKILNNMTGFLCGLKENEAFPGCRRQQSEQVPIQPNKHLQAFSQKCLNTFNNHKKFLKN